MLLTNILNGKTYDASNIILRGYCLLPLVYLCYGTWSKLAAGSWASFSVIWDVEWEKGKNRNEQQAISDIWSLHTKTWIRTSSCAERL